MNIVALLGAKGCSAAVTLAGMIFWTCQIKDKIRQGMTDGLGLKKYAKLYRVLD